MYHHQQQPSYNPYAPASLPQYATQYGNWPEQPGQEDPMTAHSFSGSLHQHSIPQYHQYPQYRQQYQQTPSQSQQYPPQDQQYGPQQRRPSPAPYIQRRSSAQERWDDYIASEECSDALQGENQVYLNQVTSELEQRAISDERLGGLAQRHGVDTQQAQQAERNRRLRWAQEMIIQNPALCAEVYCAMSKRPSAPPRRDSSRSSTATMGASRSNSSSSNSSYRGSPT